MPVSFLPSFIFVSLIALNAYYLFYQNDNIKPETYILPIPPTLKGSLSPNNKLINVKYILKGLIKGPESFYIDGDIDTIYTGTADGKIVKIVNETIVKSFVLQQPQNEIECDGSFQSQPKCGRPMGIKRFDQNRLIIADAYFGIYLVNLKLDHAEKIIKPSTNDENNNLTNVKCAFFNDVAVLDNDAIIFSCSSSRWGVGLVFHMLLEHKTDGKIYLYQISTRTIKILAENLSYCNGIELNKNKTMLFVAETGMARIWKLQLTAGNGIPQIFIDNLPGLPDNTRITSENNYFVGLAVHRSANYFSIFDFMAHYPWARQMFIEWIPESFINTYMPKLTTKYGFIIEFDESGNIVETFQDPSGETVNYISEVVESNGTLYLGSFKDDYIAKVPKNMSFLKEI